MKKIRSLFIFSLSVTLCSCSTYVPDPEVRKYEVEEGPSYEEMVEYYENIDPAEMPYYHSYYYTGKTSWYYRDY